MTALKQLPWLLLLAAAPVLAQHPTPAKAAPKTAPAAVSPAATPSAAQLLLDKSDLSFGIKQMGVPVEGRFKRYEAQLILDPKKPETGKLSFRIDLASATMGEAMADAELLKPAWFDSKKFPQAIFESSAIKSTGPGRFEVQGKLSIKGQSRDLSVPVSLAQANGVSTATGSFQLKRLEFKIGEGEWSDTSVVANDVNVKFRLQFTGIAPL